MVVIVRDEYEHGPVIQMSYILMFLLDTSIIEPREIIDLLFIIIEA